MLIVDAHLDLAYNALRGRNVLQPAREQMPDAEGIPTVGLPDLRAGGVGLICATVFCEPFDGRNQGYRTPIEAREAGWRQLQWYMQQRGARQIRIVTEPDELPSETTPPDQIHAIILLEGADPIQGPMDAMLWFQAGVRIVGLAWRQTRYAGGTGAPGPLAPDGVELVKALDELRIIHDTSHLAEESFWQLLEISAGPVIASHSNCHAFVPTDRQLSDEMIRALVTRGGVIGINFFDRFLIPPPEQPRRATLEDVLRHIRHICDLAGNDRHVAIGTDMDGGLGREQIPHEITTSSDLPRLADALSSDGFSDDAVRRIMGENWMNYFRQHLPR